MSVDTEFISSKDYNYKFKNLLRDIYVYQFKNKNIDFYGTGSFSRSRMVAVVIACIYQNLKLEDFYTVKMKDIKIQGNGVSIDISNENSSKTLTLGKPLSEMFRYLIIANPATFFLTGNAAAISKAGKEKLNKEAAVFKKICLSPRTEEKMYHYWGQVYLEETNETITTSTYRNDSERLRTLIDKMSKMAKVQWSEGCKIDYENEVLSEKSDSCIACVTSDTRELLENPFHMLYRYCNRYNNSDNDFANIFFVLILYFNIGKSIRYRNDIRVTEERIQNFNDHLKSIAAALASTKTSEYTNEEKTWEKLTPKQKERYAPKVTERFINDCFTNIIETVIGEYECQLESGDEDKEKAERVLDKLKKRFKEYKINYPERYKQRCKVKGEISWRDIAIWEDVKEDAKTLAKLKKSAQSTISADYLDVFFYLVSNKQKIKYDGSDFVLEDSEYVEKNFLYLAVVDFIECGEKQFSNIMSEFVKTGIICEKVDSGNIYYYLSDNNLKAILGNDTDLISRFSEMVSFFSQTALLGEVGSYVSDRLPPTTWKMYYKHNYIVRALNDYNIIELLYAMQNPAPEKHYWIEIECRDALNEYGYQHFVCYPIELRDNVSNGQQYLIYYHPVYRSIASIRIDFIDKVTVYKEWDKAKNFLHFGADINRAHKLIECTWGLEFADFNKGNVKSDPHPSKVTFTIQFQTEYEKDGKKFSENFIKDRIKREIKKEFGDFKEEKLNDSYSLLNVTVNVINPFDMLHWIRTYTRRIYNIKIEYSSYMDDVERANKMYILPSPERVSLALTSKNNIALYANDTKIVPIESQGEKLFNEIYSETFKKLADVLFSLIISSKKIDNGFVEQLKCSYTGAPPSALALQTEYKKYENNKKQFDYFLSRFADEAADGFVSVFSITECANVSSLYDLIPLTEIETQWLQNVLNHKLAKAFLNSKEINYIRSKLPRINWFNVFDSETVRLAERHSDASLEEYYERVTIRDVDINSEACFGNADFGIIIRKMMQAIQERRAVKVKYRSQYGRTTDYIFVPYCIEYSKRDNRFRVKAVCQTKDIDTKELLFFGVRTFPVDLISSYEETGEIIPEKVINDNVNAYKGVNEDGTKIPVKVRRRRNQGGTREIVVYFADCDGVPDKILMEFSCYEKTCLRWGNGRYRMVLTYYEEDCNEIVVRLLGYGSLIAVSSEDDNDPVVKEIKQRYLDQVNLYEKIKSIKPPTFIKEGER